MNTSIYSRWHRRLRVQLNRIDPPTGGPPVYTLTLGDKILQLPSLEMHTLLRDLSGVMKVEPCEWTEAEPSYPIEGTPERVERRTGYKRRQRCRPRRVMPPERRQDEQGSDRRAPLTGRRGVGVTGRRLDD